MWWESDAAQWAWRHFCPEPERNQVWSTPPMGMILWKPPHLLVALSADLCHGHLRRQRGHGGVPVPGGGWRSVGGSSQGDIPKWWVNDGYYMVDNIFRIFSKNWGDLRGKHGGSKDLWMGFCRLDLTGIEKMIGIGNGIWPRKPKKHKGSQRDLEDFRGNFE